MKRFDSSLGGAVKCHDPRFLRLDKFVSDWRGRPIRTLL